MTMAETLNPNRLLGPIKGLAYLTKEVPTEILYMIVEELQQDPRFATSALCSLSRTSRCLNVIFQPILYNYNVHNKYRERSALIWGARNGVLGTVKKALEYGEDVNLSHEEPLEEARKIVPTLQRRNCRMHASAIHYAVRSGNDEMVQYLLDKGASMTTTAAGLCDCPDIQGGVEYYGITPRVHSTRGDGWYPLHLALCQKHSSTAELLIKRGAPFKIEQSPRPSFLGSRGSHVFSTFGAIHTAAAFGHHRILPLMVQMASQDALGGWSTTRPGKQVEILNRWGYEGYPLHYAALSPYSNEETIRTLVHLGAEVDKVFDTGTSDAYPDKHLLTALGAAVQRGCWSSVFTLQSLGADIAGVRFRYPQREWDKALVTIQAAVFPAQPEYSYPWQSTNGTQSLGVSEITWGEQQREVIRRILHSYPEVDLNNGWDYDLYDEMDMNPPSSQRDLLALGAANFWNHWNTAKDTISLLREHGVHGRVPGEGRSVLGEDGGDNGPYTEGPVAMLASLYASNCRHREEKGHLFYHPYKPERFTMFWQKKRALRNAIIDFLQHGAVLKVPKTFTEPEEPPHGLPPPRIFYSSVEQAMYLIKSPNPRNKVAGLRLLRLLARHAINQPDSKLDELLEQSCQEVKKQLALPAELYTPEWDTTDVVTCQFNQCACKEGTRRNWEFCDPNEPGFHHYVDGTQELYLHRKFRYEDGAGGEVPGWVVEGFVSS